MIIERELCRDCGRGYTKDKRKVAFLANVSVSLDEV